MSIRAILFGATGMVGEGVLQQALTNPAVDAVLVIGRRPCGVSHPKLRELIHTDFVDYASIMDQLHGYDACFFCLGVTSIGKSETEYRQLTYDLTMAAAQALVKANPGMVFCYVSGLGTDSSEQGRSMWARIKGKTENDLMRLPFKAVYAFRPGFIRPVPGNKNSLLLAKLLSPLFPLLRRLLPKYVCSLEDVGRAMIRVVVQGESMNILECSDIARLGRADGGMEKRAAS